MRGVEVLVYRESRGSEVRRSRFLRQYRGKDAGDPVRTNRDIINVAGHRLSTGEMEEIVGMHPAVAECAVIGRDDDLKGQMPLGFVVLKSGVEMDHDELVAELVQLVRKEIGAVACFKEAHVVPRLPKTRSGKILRGTMVKIADGEEFKMPATIDDPAILDEVGDALRSLGYARG